MIQKKEKVKSENLSKNNSNLSDLQRHLKMLEQNRDIIHNNEKIEKLRNLYKDFQ